MAVVVDTSVWSLMFRRDRGVLSARQRMFLLWLRGIVGQGEAALLGTVRQEILTGIPDRGVFARLRDELRQFDDEPITRQDHELAALGANEGLKLGFRASPTDWIIAAVSIRLGAPILTLDSDFDRLGSVLPIRLVRP